MCVLIATVLAVVVAVQNRERLLAWWQAILARVRGS